MAREVVALAAAAVVVCSVRIVVLWAIQALWGVRGGGFLWGVLGFAQAY